MTEILEATVRWAVCRPCEWNGPRCFSEDHARDDAAAHDLQQHSEPQERGHASHRTTSHA